MAGAGLYGRLPVAAQHLATAAYGLRMRRVRYGGVYARTRRRLAVSERLSAGELRELQTRELRRVVLHAVSRAPYFRTLFQSLGLTPDRIRTAEDLRRLPVLDKETILAHADELRAEGVARVRTYFSGPPQSRRFTTG